MSDEVAVVVVTHNSEGELPDLALTVLAQLTARDEVLIIDNASHDRTVAIARGLGERVRVIESPRNVGFAAGCRIGVKASEAPLLMLLNPDARLEPGALERLRAVAAQRRDWAAWQPAVMLPDGRINSAGGIVHYLGIGWAGLCGEPAAALATEPHEVAFASGAALVVRREAWVAVDGLEDSYFLYGEDLDFGLRLWLAGRRVGVEPAARVTHDYSFEKGAHKWFLLERNRWRTVLAVYPLGLLIAVAPALIAGELGLLVVAAREGWLRAKLRSQIATLFALVAVARRRRRVQAASGIGSREFARQLGASLDSPFIAPLPRVIVAGQAGYWRLVRRCLR